MIVRRVLAMAPVVVLLVPLGSRPARADAPPFAPLHLTYTVAGAAVGKECPDEAAFRRLVALRLGVDPFVAPAIAASRTLVVAVAVAVERGAPRTVTVTLADANGKSLGQRVIREPPPACDELVANAAFAASVAIDPNVLTRQAPALDPPMRSGREPTAPVAKPAMAVIDARTAEAPSPSLSPPAALALVPSLRAGAGISAGVLPSLAVGLTLGASVQRERFSAGIEGRFDLPTDTDIEAKNAARTRVTTSTSLLIASVHACGHLRASGLSPYLCVMLQAGTFASSSSGIATTKDDASAYVAVGPRLGVTLPVGGSLAIDLRLEAPFALTKVELRVDDRTVWSGPVAGVVAGAGAALAFP